MSNNTKLLCLFLKAQKIDRSSEQGYAMVVVSMLSIVMFSLLAASMIFSNLAKSKTNAFVDGQSAFYVAESGLNQRAIEFNAKLNTYSGVFGMSDGTGFRELANCFGVSTPAIGAANYPTGTNDFECRNYRFKSNNNTANTVLNGNIALDSGNTDQNTYIAYTLVSDRTSYAPNTKSPQSISIPTGEPYEGLNAGEYKYELYSTAKKPITLTGGTTLPTYTVAEIAAKNRQQRGELAKTDDTSLIGSYDTKKTASIVAAATSTAAVAADKSSNNLNLSMTFINRVIPLFQFGVFYNGDIEFNSTSPMQMRGWVHSNANIYAQPAGIAGQEANSVTTFLAKVSAKGSIYNRVDAWIDGTTVRTGITKVLLTGDDCTTGTCQNFPYSYGSYDESVKVPLTTTQIDAFPNNKVQDGNAGVVELKTPSPGFTRKRNYNDNTVGIYYAQADMRLEMVPDRDVTNKSATPWTRNKAIIPFNFTSIRTGGTGTCTTTITAGSDPAANYVDPQRDNYSTALHCNVLTKGQLQSLRQPVMVLTHINQNNSNTAQTTTQLRATESTTLGIPTAASPVPYPTVLPILSASGNTSTVKNKILRALQIALVSTPSPIPFDRLDTPFGEPVYDNVSTYPTYDAEFSAPLNAFRTAFSNLIGGITELSSVDRTRLLAASSNQIAALQGAWFMPAPIQRVETKNLQDAANNLRSSGFYDAREQRWMTMLQTNIASLSVWNRDGLSVEPTDLNVRTAYSADDTTRSTVLTNINANDLARVTVPNTAYITNSTNGMAFDLATADSSKLLGSLQYLGLGSSDTTEGGLVFHASVSDDLDGNGGALVAANDITVDKTNTANRILKKKPDNTNFLDPVTGAVVILDYLRTYPGSTARKQSPFAFAFNGGDFLPNALSLVSDQSVYVQGNFNNNGNILADNTANIPSPNRLPASIIGDTITALSNECTSIDPGISNSLKVPMSQLKCGLPRTIDGVSAIYDTVNSAMAINAAFLSNTNISSGNYHASAGGPVQVTPLVYSGGVNNYIRLLEDWGGTFALNYNGSLISLGEPIEYSGVFQEGGIPSTSYYNVPFRNFNYDPFFTQVQKIPPLTPKANYVVQKNFGHTY
jgi:Tfp pilus assembly protein PilX